MPNKRRVQPRLNCRAIDLLMQSWRHQSSATTGEYHDGSQRHQDGPDRCYRGSGVPRRRIRVGGAGVNSGVAVADQCE